MSEQRVLIFPPTRRDGEVTRELLERAGMTGCVCPDALSLSDSIVAGAGAVVLTDAASTAPDIDKVFAALSRQPSWSDLPVVLLCQAGTHSPFAAGVMGSLTNVTLLDRPTSARTLLSAIETAIRARMRQYQIRDQIKALREADEALRERERQLHTLAENTPDLLSRFDRDLRHVFINQAARRATGIDVERFIGHTNRELGMPKDVSDAFEAALRSVFETAQRRSIEFTLVGPQGTRHYSNLLVPELGTADAVETVLCVSHDVTASKDAEDTLRMADRRKDEFLAMLAHELRNPLAPIRNASELLARLLPADPTLQATAGIVKRQVTHLTRLVDDLLDVSRITQGRIELQRQPLDIAVVIVHALESVEPLVREKRHRIIVSSGDERLFVDGDFARLVQCVANMLTNAAKYTDAGGEIRIESRRESTQAVICITDNGVGIPEELLRQIFELFVQSDRSLDRSQGGLGIGLSVVQRLIDMHGGTVTAHSRGPGCGATFRISLPLVAAPSETAQEPVARAAPARRILIVDDNADAADSLALVLKMDGHAAEPVYSPTEALERASAFDPEVILLDIGLPGMDGYEVARRIRAQGSTAQIVALTGYGQAEDIQRARAAGFDAHLVKPVDLQTLTRKLSG